MLRVQILPLLVFHTDVPARRFQIITTAVLARVKNSGEVLGRWGGYFRHEPLTKIKNGIQLVQ